MDLRDVVDIKTLQEVQDKFTESVHMGAIITDTKGRPLTVPSNFSELCKLIRSSPEGMKRCIKSDTVVSSMAFKEKKTATHVCHAGLVDMASPIVVNNKYLGSVLCGQVLLSPADQRSEKELYELALNLNLNPELFINLFKKIPVIPEQNLHSATNLLWLVAQYFVNVGIRFITEKELHNKTLRILEEQKSRAELEKSLKSMELKALQSQVNPHFLFNTLNIISRLAMLENATKTEEVVYALADMLRYNLGKIDKIVTVASELKNVQDYMFITKLRFGDKIKFSIDVPEYLLPIRLPLLTIQPLVENAILHGLEPNDGKGEIKIIGYRKQNNLHLEIFDNGIGIDNVEEINNILENHQLITKDNSFCIGLLNVHRRIQHHCGQKYGLRLESLNGTKVIIEVPLIEGGV